MYYTLEDNTKSNRIPPKYTGTATLQGGVIVTDIVTYLKGKLHCTNAPAWFYKQNSKSYCLLSIKVVAESTILIVV